MYTFIILPYIAVLLILYIGIYLVVLMHSYDTCKMYALVLQAGLLINMNNSVNTHNCKHSGTGIMGELQQYVARGHRSLLSAEHAGALIRYSHCVLSAEHYDTVSTAH